MTGISTDLWVLASLAAAGFQTLRFMLQKVLSTAVLSPTGATFARFFYSAPVIAVLVAFYVAGTGQALPATGLLFWGWALTGALAQVTATIFVVTLFKSRNFAVGVTLMKTEVILSVIIGLVLLGEGVSLAAFGAIALGLVGVLLLSTPPQIAGGPRMGMFNRGIALGLGSGVLFAVSAVCYRGASLELQTSDPLLRAGLTLAAVTGAQMTGMALWLWLRDAPQIAAVWRARRVAGWIGVTSMAGSFCWFLAFTLQTAAYVKAVGQVELVLSLLASRLFFGERSTWRELAGMAVICGSVISLVLVI
ncbi:DMT family transporter [Roseobacter ponti]|uniref:DMT family transporter n=1 Tax=Roseobacter ponti TaxID=1891787 RepID=A0A858SU96_9RHOB|nr:DMT family transporter [Roseobacter ponti]QJF51577.1 DMT family transporter [Roseobacter ponti]